MIGIEVKKSIFVCLSVAIWLLEVAAKCESKAAILFIHILSTYVNVLVYAHTLMHAAYKHTFAFIYHASANRLSRYWFRFILKRKSDMIKGNNTKGKPIAENRKIELSLMQNL